MKEEIQKLSNNSNKTHCQICNNTEFLVEHHIRGRKIDKPNHPSNLCNICSNCHTKIHRGFIIIEGWFMTTDGMQLITHTKDEESLTGQDAICHQIKPLAVSL